MKILELLAKTCAILAGVLLVAITLLTCASVLGRELIGKAINGDFELVGVAAGAAIALFLPWCQIRRGNIIVDFFTAKLKPSTNRQLDRLAALLLAMFMGVLSWRTFVGGLNAWQSGAGSMMMGFPDWITYTFMVPPLALTTVIALFQAAKGDAEAGDTNSSARCPSKIEVTA